MIATRLKQNNQGVGAMGVLAVIVVVAIVVAAGVLVSKHSSKKDSTTNNASSSQSTANSATKSVSDVTLSADVASMATTLDADHVSKANELQQQTSDVYFTVAGGKSVQFHNTGEDGAIEWGATLKKVEGSDYKGYIQSVGEQAYKNISGVSVSVGSKSSQDVTGSDSKKYTLDCYDLTAKKDTTASYGIYCLGEVQKSTVLVLAESKTDAATARTNLITILTGATATLQ